MAEYDLERGYNLDTNAGLTDINILRDEDAKSEV